MARLCIRISREPAIDEMDDRGERAGGAGIDFTFNDRAIYTIIDR